MWLVPSFPSAGYFYLVGPTLNVSFIVNNLTDVRGKIHNEVQGRKETLYWKTNQEVFIKGGAVAIGMRLAPTGICQHYQGQLDFGFGFWVSFCFGS